MKLILEPEQLDLLSLRQQATYEQESLRQAVSKIMESVRENGDVALAEYNLKFDQYQGPLALSEAEYEAGSKACPEDLKAAIDRAYTNIRTYHLAQKKSVERIETSPGINCWRESRPIESVGLYIPGGSAPLFSTVLMLGVPAQIAANPERILCTPVKADGKVNPAILYAAKLCGISKIFRCGGAQAIAAMSFGTDSIPKVAKLFGPGNSYVTIAKQEALNYGLAIDMPAGPSEVLVIADQEADPVLVASDLLSQAEHGVDSQVILLSDSIELIRATQSELNKQLNRLPRREIAIQALAQSYAICLRSLEKAFELSNRYAPEHLILNLSDPQKWIDKIQAAGSVFLGPFAAESMGDYASGTNHTLPTAGFAKTYSGLSLESFQVQISFQEVQAEAIQDLGPAVIKMAEAEGLEAHAEAIRLRINKIEKK